MFMRPLLAAATLAVLMAAGIAGDARADERDAKSIHAMRISLTQAIETAERQAGGKAVSANFDAEDGGRGEYEIKVLTADRLVRAELDAATGQVRVMENQPVERFFSLITPEQLRGAPTTLAQAIGVAEQRVGGKAIEAGVESDDGKVHYEVTVAMPGSSGAIREVRIDAASGQVAAVK